MRPVWAVVAFLGCGASARPRPRPAAEPAAGAFATEEWYAPSYDAPALQRALIGERGAEATGQRIVAELEARGEDEDRLRVARADLAVRRRFIASLEACRATGRACPPRLDDPAWAFDPDPDVPVAGPLAPPLDAPLRFDLASWRAIAAELHGRACACRTIACVDSVGVAIDQLEVRPMPAVQGDDAASLAITRGRECLFRLRGRKPTPG